MTTSARSSAGPEDLLSGGLAVLTSWTWLLGALCPDLGQPRGQGPHRQGLWVAPWGKGMGGFLPSEPPGRVDGVWRVWGCFSWNPSLGLPPVPGPGPPWCAGVVSSRPRPFGAWEEAGRWGLGVLDGLLPPSGNRALPSGSFKSWGGHGEAGGHLGGVRPRGLVGSARWAVRRALWLQAVLPVRTLGLFFGLRLAAQVRRWGKPLGRSDTGLIIRACLPGG